MEKVIPFKKKVTAQPDVVPHVGAWIEINKKKGDKTMETITMKNIEIFENIQTIQRQNETGKLGYALAKNLRKMTDAAQEYLVERDNALMKFGEDQGNGQFRIPKEKLPEFIMHMSEYDDLESEFQVYHIPEDVFYSGSLNTKDMYTLAWMVEPDDKED